MPRIDDRYAKSIVYLYPTLEDAQEGKTTGATGFLVSIPFEHKVNGQMRHNLGFIVTNDHVVSKGIEAVRLNRHDRTSDALAIKKDSWNSHPDGDDLAIAIALVDANIYDHSYIPSDLFITQDFIDQHDVGMGDEVFVIGRFRYHEGRKQNLPSAQFGYISQMPNEPVQVQREIDYTSMQDAFLVEMRSIGGYSGSPAFLYLPPFTHRMTKDRKSLNGNSYLRLLGVNFGHLPTNDLIVDKSGLRVNDWYTKSNSAMTGVIPAWKLNDILSDELLRAEKEFKRNHINSD